MAFWRLSVSTSDATSDALTNFLWEQGALGVVEEESPSAPPHIDAFFPETASSTGLVHAVNAYRASLRALGFSMSPAEPEVTALLDGDWAHAWQQAFPPIEVGPRIVIVPPWDARPDDTTGGRVQVIIEPGRAFGTGHHGSTEGCLLLTEEAFRTPRRSAPRVLDIGTGTGILAITAIKLGAPAVLAIDVDPDAISAARLNAERNGCADRVALTLAGPEAVSGRELFDLVLANLLSHTHLALLPQYIRLVGAEGVLVLGGILADEDQLVIDAFGAAGFEHATRLVIDGWSALRFRRPARP